jgi:hypothetical protein
MKKVEVKAVGEETVCLFVLVFVYFIPHQRYSITKLATFGGVRDTHLVLLS